MWFIKLAGLVIVVFVCTFIGISKSRLLAERCRKLTVIYDGTSNLYEQVENGGCELAEAVKSSFSAAQFLCFNDRLYIREDNGLTKADIELINSFFSTLGLSPKRIECDKINNFKVKLNANITQARIDHKQKGKIYQTFGICIGLTLAVLLI